MKNVTIKNVPEDVMDLLRARASRNRRSLQGELRTILEEAVGQLTLTVDEAYEQIRALGLRTPDESTAMIREDRDAR
jgi:plasmid stability protein